MQQWIFRNSRKRYSVICRSAEAKQVGFSLRHTFGILTSKRSSFFFSSGSFQSQDEQNGAVDFDEFMRHFAYPLLQNIIHNPQRQDQQQAFRPSAPTPGQNPPSTVGFSFSSSNPSASASGPQAPQQQQQQQQQQPAPLFQG